jgi:hypothetical protein
MTATKYPFDDWGFSSDKEDYEGIPRILMAKLFLELRRHLASVVDILEEACDEYPHLITDLVEAQEQYRMVSNAYVQMSHAKECSE